MVLTKDVWAQDGVQGNCHNVMVAPEDSVFPISRIFILNGMAKDVWAQGRVRGNCYHVMNMLEDPVFLISRRRLI